jgi:hypothetical protein
MKYFLSSILLISVCLVQVHSVVEIGYPDHDTNHSCIICDIHSKQLGILPELRILSLDSAIVFENLVLVSTNYFPADFSIINKLIPRAPPLI